MKLPYTILLTLLLFLPTSVFSTELTIFTWEDYTFPKILDDFTQKTGVKINLIYFDNDQTRNEIMASPRGDKFDIVVFDNISSQIFGKNNIIEAISSSQVNNLQNIDKRWQESCGNFGIPYFFGSMGIVYDSSKFQKPPKSWLDLLKPEKEHQGHVVMLEDMNDILVPPLISLGHNVNSEKPEELKAAYNLLREQMPAVLRYRYVLTSTDDKAFDSAIHLALAFSGDEATLNEITKTENWKFITPQEGSVAWVDCMTITSSSPHKKEAVEFLNYINDTKVAALNSEMVYNASPVSNVKNYVSAEVAEDTHLFPSEIEIDKWQRTRILSNNNLHQRKRILDSIVKQHEAQ